MSALEIAPELLAAAQVRRHRISVADYELMGRAGAFGSNRRVELIEGEIFHMASLGTRHRSALVELNRLLVETVGKRAQVGCQVPLTLSNYSEPEPDFCIWRADAPRGAATGSDTLLAIEIADTSIAFDAEVKAPLYARHGVQEYWILDLAERRVLRHADLQDGQWQTVQALPVGASLTLALPGLPDLAVDLAPVF